MSIVNALIALAVVGLLIARQLQARPAREDSALRLTLILGVLGVVETSHAFDGHHVEPAAVLLIVFSLVLGAGLGAIRGLTVRVWRAADGTAWRRGSWVTAGLWVVSLAVHLGLDVAIDHAGHLDGLGLATIMLYLAVTLGAQREVIRARIPAGTAATI